MLGWHGDHELRRDFDARSGRHDDDASR
jgi:hypothetical protein